MRASSGGRPVAGGERVEQGLVPVVGLPALVERADDGGAADCASARRERQLAEQEREQRRLAAAVPARHRDALAGGQIEVDRAEPECASLAHSTFERGDAVARTLRGGEREVQPPGLVRLLDVLDPLQRPLGLAHLSCERLRSAPVGATGRMREEGPACPRLVSARVEQRLDLAAALLGVGERGVLPLPRQLPGRRVLAPAAGVLVHAARPRVDLRDPGCGSVEEDAIVRDHRDATCKAVDEALEPVEAVEVEVVRRLVEQEHVEAGEQNRGQPGPRGFAAGERRRLLVERDGEPELGARRPRSRLEIGASEREEALERSCVRVGAPGGGVPFDGRLGIGDAGTTGQVRQQRLAGTPVVLLGQVADRQCRGRSLDPSLVRLVEPGEQAEQRRLAGPVGADEPEPRTRPERQVDMVENGAGAERADDAVERDAQRSLQRRGTRTGRRVERRSERLGLV